MKSLESACAASPQEHIITNLTKREVELNKTIKAKAGFEKLTNQLKLNKTTTTSIYSLKDSTGILAHDQQHINIQINIWKIFISFKLITD